MKRKNLQIVLFCVILWVINQVEGQTAKCDYMYEYHWTDRYRTKNASYYNCYLNIRQANYDEKLTRIDGQHGTGHTDADVKWIQNYMFNKLKIFSSIFCQKFPNLEVIHIDDAELESIDEDSLTNCKNLDKLWLFENKIRELPEYLLIRNSKLTYFRIQNNELTTLPENLFLNQKQLEELWSVRNQISFLPSKIFHPLVKLELLYLSNNKLKSINPEWFLNLQNLKWLALEGNKISEIPLKCFAKLVNLERLILYGNKIKILNLDSFDGLEKLQTLNLNNNEISDLPVGVFSQLRSLQDLSLSNNKLTTIHSDSFGIHNQLTTVWLGNNKINVIDEKFIDNTAVSTLNMNNNICSQQLTGIRSQIKSNLKKCFDNYQPRFQPVQVNSCGKGLKAVNTIIGGTEVKRGMFPW